MFFRDKPFCTYREVYIVLADFPSSDDLTVQVIFFGEGPSTGEVTVNDEASAPSKADTRAKL